MKPLTFEHKGNTYYIDFMRMRKDVPIREEYDGKRPLKPGTQSTHPYTTVFIWLERDGHPDGDDMFRTATSGCYHKDKFSPEEGRLRALRLVGKTLSKEMRKLMWESYTRRPKGIPDKPKVEVPVVVGEIVG